MIKVTVGEQKTQSEKPFPKLMQTLATTDRKPFIVYFEKAIGGKNVVINNSGSYKAFDLFERDPNDNFTDYNEPITIQNA